MFFFFFCNIHKIINTLGLIADIFACPMHISCIINVSDKLIMADLQFRMPPCNRAMETGDSKITEKN